MDTNGSFTSSFLRLNVFVQFFVAVTVISLCTRVFSGHLFTVAKNGRQHEIAPPTLPHWTPGLRHALRMAYSAKRFLAQSLNKYGDGTPFFIDAAGEKLLIVLNPEHVRKILRSSSELDANPFVHEKILGQLMGSPQSAIDYYKSPESTVDHDQMMQVRQHTSGSALSSLDDKLFDTLKHNITKSYVEASGDKWTDIPDLYAFFEDQATRAVAETLLGSAIVDSYPSFAEDLWTFIESTDTLLLGLPRFMASEAYGARDRLLSHFKTWGRQADELRKQDKVNTQWDPIAGSTLMQEREKLYSSLPGHGEDGRAAQTLGLLYAGTSLMVPVTFWFFYETLRNPSLRTRVYSELTSHRDLTTSKYDFAQLSATPFLQSLYAESARKYSASLVARQVISPVFALDDRYIVKQGTTVLIPSKFAGQYTAAWASVRPALVSKPLSEFWAERFLVTGTAGKERFSDAGLAGNWTSFGGGEHKCPGRFFARDIGIVALAILFGEFEVEMVDPEGARKLDPVSRREAFGTMRPGGKVAARIRRRHE
ncbi:cytochrome P450 [Macroventuria anomochaeta]|uniref:Cytochrome P450 n=1 Tax=Macroventuria anomochaeta TaxID=301207 RepID=A0ACB6SIB7_9PLEO|nr:cytochrome P450 [Macroventuria anomochaeta]KAF2633991.1 cytochrome P450 [Macroventuria anomochaeta]